MNLINSWNEINVSFSIYESRKKKSSTGEPIVTQSIVTLPVIAMEDLSQTFWSWIVFSSVLRRCYLCLKYYFLYTVYRFILRAVMFIIIAYQLYTIVRLQFSKKNLSINKHANQTIIQLIDKCNNTCSFDNIFTNMECKNSK